MAQVNTGKLNGSWNKWKSYVGKRDEYRTKLFLAEYINHKMYRSEHKYAAKSPPNIARPPFPYPPEPISSSSSYNNPLKSYAASGPVTPMQTLRRRELAHTQTNSFPLKTSDPPTHSILPTKRNSAKHKEIVMVSVNAGEEVEIEVGSKCAIISFQEGEMESLSNPLERNKEYILPPKVHRWMYTNKNAVLLLKSGMQGEANAQIHIQGLENRSHSELKNNENPSTHEEELNEILLRRRREKKARYLEAVSRSLGKPVTNIYGTTSQSSNAPLCDIELRVCLYKKNFWSCFFEPFQRVLQQSDALQDPYRVLFVCTPGCGLGRSVVELMANMAALRGKSSVLVDLDATGRMLTSLPGTISAVRIEEPIRFAEGMDACLPLFFASGTDPSRKSFSKACESLAHCILPAFVWRDEVECTGPLTPTQPFGGTIVLCCVHDQDVLRGNELVCVWASSRRRSVCMGVTGPEAA